MFFTYDAAGKPLTLEYHDAFYCQLHSGGSCSSYCETYYYVTNLQGDVIALLDSSGDVDSTYTYDAWGNPIDISVGGYIEHINPLRYRGYVYDRETGLYYLQSRYYNPEIGRFISGDKQLNAKDGPVGCNMFAYCNNNPVNFFDPMGNSAIAVCIFIAACTLVGAACGAFAASCTGEDILEATIEGAITGAIAAAVTLAIPELMAVLLPATLKAGVAKAITIGATFIIAATGGLLTDLTIQAINQDIGKTPANAGVDWGRALKTAGMTGLAAVVPTFVKPFESVSNAIMASVVSMDASVINAAAEIVVTIFLK